MKMRKMPVSLTIGAVALGVLAAARRAGRRDERDLEGKVVVITGGSRGLGFLIARELGREGCRVVIGARDPEELERAYEALRFDGATVHAVACDVRRRESAEDLIAEARLVYGGVDILVNNAGIIQVAPLETLDEDVFQDAMDTMYWGAVHTTLAVLPEMVAKRSGDIVNVTSFGGFVGVPRLSPYVSAKFAAAGFSQAAHAELAKYGINVLTVAPGPMRTGSPSVARFGGRAKKEFSWFQLAASLPVFSTNAERAARQIVAAIKRRDPMLVIGLPFRLAIPLAGLMPGVTSRVLSVFDRVFLPAPLQQAKGLVSGAQLRQEASAGFKALTHLEDVAEERYQKPSPGERAS